MIILIDTREQKPYLFKKEGVKTQKKALKSGDYSIAGHEENGISIERKSKIDAYGTIGAGRERFRKELQRLSKFNYAALVIECSMAEFIKQPERSKLHPKSAIQSLLTWSIRYNIHIFFCENRRFAEAVTLSLLEKYYKEMEQDDRHHRIFT